MAYVGTGSNGFKSSLACPSHSALPIRVPASRPNGETATPLQSFKSGHLNLNTFSPVNQNGSFEFDRVLKSGRVHRRVKSKGAWKPTWKATYLVLRPNLLSIYKHDDETGIRASITLSDVTAVAPVKKANTANVFGVFTPSKNYHFQGTSAADTADWIERIRTETRVDVHEEIALGSPIASNDRPGTGNPYETTDLSADDMERPSSSEVSHWPVRGQAGYRSRASTIQRQPSALQEYSANEMMTSYSDFSDPPALGTSLARTQVGSVDASANATAGEGHRQNMARNPGRMNVFNANTDPERVIRQGWLDHLKSKTGVRKWKRWWVVLRPKNISFYKNEQQYSVVKIVPMSSVINAVEIDPISKSKKYCLQVIGEDRTYRFCASGEDSLAEWLGALKSVLARRQDAGK